MKRSKKDRKDVLIRSTSHSFPMINIGKDDKLATFLEECRNVAKQMLDHLWENRIEWSSKDGDKFFDIQNDFLEIPTMLSTTHLLLKTNLTARVQKCLITQVLGVIRAVSEVRRRRQFVRDQLKLEGKDFSKIQIKLEKQITKPSITKMNIELNSICADFQESNSLFCGFVGLHSLGNDSNNIPFGEIRIPIKTHRRQQFWKEKGKVMTSFLVGKKFLNIRWEIEKPKTKTDGISVGADQGITDVLKLGNNRTTPKTDSHGHSLSSIQKKLSKKLKGSKAFANAQDHRENFINWSINQLGFSGIKEIKMEKIHNIRKGKKTNRFLSHWAYPLIQRKVQSKAEETGVLIKLQSNAFRSQRCSCCGFVFADNRNKKVFQCLNCGFTDDADLNASWNHEAEIPEIYWSRKLSDLSKESGFFWLEELRFPVERNLASGVRSPWHEKVVEFKWFPGNRIPQKD